jgi:hypothetical protein
VNRIASLECQAEAKANMLAAIFGATAASARVAADGQGNGGIAFSLTKSGKRLDVSITSGPNGTECSVSDDARGGEVEWTDSAAGLNKFLAIEFA